MSFLIEGKWFTSDNVAKFINFLLENDWKAYPTQFNGAFIYKNLDKDGYEASFSFPVVDRINWESLSLRTKFSDIICAVADFYNQTPEDFFHRLVQVKDSADTLLIKIYEGETDGARVVAKCVIPKGIVSEPQQISGIVLLDNEENVAAAGSFLPSWIVLDAECEIDYNLKHQDRKRGRER
jgi:hypothetical protein